VLCEKPLALNAAQAHRLVEAARGAGRVAMTCFNCASRPPCRNSTLSSSAAPAWRMDRAQAGHGAMGAHLIDLVRW
jgi:predicted dehydrogenase